MLFKISKYYMLYNKCYNNLFNFFTSFNKIKRLNE